jgi:hypothetical protein
MSNIKTTPAEWADARKHFEGGLLLREISKLTGISVPSLSRRANREKWLKIGVDRSQEPINKPDDTVAKQVKAMAAYGLMDEEIASVLGMKVDLLRATYERELVTANPEMVARVAQSMFRMATDQNKPNVTAAIFWLKCRGGWNDDPTKAVIGKKEQRVHAAAKVAAGRYAPAAAPRLVAVK